MVIVCRLAKAGYGTVRQVRYEMDAREVLQALYYEIFCSEYEEAYMELNK